MKELKVEPIGGCRRPKNHAEAVFYDACLNHGVDVVRKGWPDFACFQAGKFFVVEVKARRSQRLKKEQMLILRILASYGIRAYKWSPDAGFVRVNLRPAPLARPIEPAGTPASIKRTIRKDLRRSVPYLLPKM